MRRKGAQARMQFRQCDDLPVHLGCDRNCKVSHDCAGLLADRRHVVARRRRGRKPGHDPGLLRPGHQFLDTAYCYGVEGESERLIARAVAGRRHEMVIATKGGIEWGPAASRSSTAGPPRCAGNARKACGGWRPIGSSFIICTLPIRSVPIAESAGEIRRLIAEGKVLSAGVSNVDLAQLEAFAAECPLTAFQPPYNMLQREIEADTLPWCRQQGVAVMVYWPLLKGLLAGQLPRDHVFAPGDSRLKYPMFHGEEWQKNQDLVDALRARGRRGRPQRGPGGDQLDDPSAGHHRRLVRGQAARPDSRQRRRDGLAVDGRPIGRDRRGPGRPRQSRSRNRRCELIEKHEIGFAHGLRALRPLDQQTPVGWRWSN